MEPAPGRLADGEVPARHERGRAGHQEARYQRELGREAWRERDNEETWRVVEAVVAVAEETGRTPAQVSLRWLLGRPAVAAPIIGVRTVEQLADNLGAVGWELTPEQTVRLDEASARPLPYPYDVLHRFRDREPQG